MTRPTPSLLDVLVAGARARPDATALVTPTGTRSYGALLDEASRVAGALLDGRPDLDEARVAILVSPGIGWVAATLGVWRAGGMAVPLPLAAPAPELRQALEDAAPEAVIVDPDLRERVEEAATGLGVQVLEAEALAGGAPVAEDALPAVPAERGALMLYTSGTTGRPKGVVHTHASLGAQVRALHEAWGWTADDHVLLNLPLHHVHGIVNVVLCALAAGARCTVLPRFDAAAVWRSLTEDGLTLFRAVPPLYGRLLAEEERADEATRARWRAGARSLRLHVSGSAALPVQVLEAWEALTGHRLLERYGMTEIGMALSNPLEGERVAGHVGRPLPGVEVRVTDDDGTPVEPGTPGELQVRGPAVFREYWRRPEETAKAFTPDGWFLTGDEVVETPRGFRILGRRSVDILKSGGEKLSALEIEEMLRTHPGIADCAVVGVPDPDWGERVCAAVVGLAGSALESSDLRTWAAKRLSPWKVPREFRVVEDLPRNALGKVLKPEVRRLFS